MQNDRLNWTVPSIKKISNEKKKMEGATNQFPRHTRALNQFITMLSSRSSFLLSVGDLSQKKKKSRWPSRYYYYHHQKKPSGLVYKADWIFPSPPFPSPHL
jgi:hypothetical protein